MNYCAPILTLLGMLSLQVETAAPNPIPVIFEPAPVSPKQLHTGLHVPVIVVEGMGFSKNSVVHVNGAPVPTVLVGGELLAGVPDRFLTEAETLTISVMNPPPGGGVSEPVLLEVIKSSPQIKLTLDVSNREIKSSQSFELMATVENIADRTYWLPKRFTPFIVGSFVTYSLEVREVGQVVFEPFIAGHVLGGPLAWESEEDYARNGYITLLPVGQTYSMSAETRGSFLLSLLRLPSLPSGRQRELRIVSYPVRKPAAKFNTPIVDVPHNQTS